MEGHSSSSTEPSSPVVPGDFISSAEPFSRPSTKKFIFKGSCNSSKEPLTSFPESKSSFGQLPSYDFMKNITIPLVRKSTSDHAPSRPHSDDKYMSDEEPSSPFSEKESTSNEEPSTPSARNPAIEQDFSDSVHKLKTKDHENILNVIDQLRLEGINTYIDLPQIVVCGDQSSGKSSVLEAISGLNFPADDNVCTRFATELILRRADEIGVTATIRPHHDRSPKHKKLLRDVKFSKVGLEDFASIVKKVGAFVKIGDEHTQFSKDILRVEVTGPKQPHLTLVDLPGLFSGTDKEQGKNDAALVDSLVTSYMNNKRSLILAVISAKSDIPLQKVTRFINDIDPRGERIMGIITKPDTLSKGSNMERSFFELAMNKRQYFRFNWHVLKNRDYEQRSYTLQERNASESEVLNSGIWTALPPTRKGIDSLSPRLSSILKDHIIDQLPAFIDETQESFDETQEQLERLGDPRHNLNDQRRYLQRSSERFRSLIVSAIEPSYNDSYFGDAMNDDDYNKRLCTVVQNYLSDFNTEMLNQGHLEEIVADGVTVEGKQINRSDYVQKVHERIRRTRGRELPGTFNPLIIGDLFHTQCKPWETITDACTKDILSAIRNAVLLISEEVLDGRTRLRLLEHVIYPSLDELGDIFCLGTSELLKPHQTGHPITLNKHFTENMQKARQEHSRIAMLHKLRSFFGPNYSEVLPVQPPAFRMTELANTLSARTEADMVWFSCSEAVDYMAAYYKVRVFSINIP